MGKILCRLPVHDKGFFKIMIFHFFFRVWMGKILYRAIFLAVQFFFAVRPKNV
jgi:hypothetical protein